MAELVDALVSNTNGAIRAGSIPALGTEARKVLQLSSLCFFSNIYAQTKKEAEASDNLLINSLLRKIIYIIVYLLNFIFSLK